MGKNSSVLWIGGDVRQAVAAKTMHDLGWDTAVCLAKDPNSATGKTHTDWRLAFKQSQILVFPLPMTRKGLYVNASFDVLMSDILMEIQPGATVLGGMIPLEICEQLAKKNVVWFDYYGEALQIQNALPTAEAAIGIALLEYPRILSGARALVIGYGKIGKILAGKLQLLGVRVTVGARKSTDLALAKSLGQDTISISSGISPDAVEGVDIIFNTAPVFLFDERMVRHMERKTLYIELASRPYGIDFEIAKAFGVRALLAEGLPGKYAPITAGELLAENVVQILKKEGLSP